MRIAIPVDSLNASANLSRKFARSPFFVIVDKNEKSVQLIENPFVDMETGLGKKLLDHLAGNYQVNTLMAFELGIKVQQISAQMKLQLIVVENANATLKQLMNKLDVNI